MFLKVHPENPSPRHVSIIVEKLREGGIVIFPTDTIYAIGCDSRQGKAFEKICRLRGVAPEKANFSFLMADLSEISHYTKPFDREIFKLLKSHLPGPFTFILPAGNMVPTPYRNKRKTIGIRVPANKIIQAVILELGAPVISASLRDDMDTIAEYLTDPEEINDRFSRLADIVVDGGYGKNVASTVIDCTGDEPVYLRKD
jgi:tRNA threonylcarbamoyl adenosine modification protein (Sua5/YciO/YrdC/YwlC family)